HLLVAADSRRLASSWSLVPFRWADLRVIGEPPTSNSSLPNPHSICTGAQGAQLPTGHPSWPTLRGTFPQVVLRARDMSGCSPPAQATKTAQPGAHRGTGSVAALCAGCH